MMVVVALGITWILDGLEVTVVGAIGPRLQQTSGLGLSPTQIGEAATAYLIGAAGGALFFGHLTDRFGRKRLFLVTLGAYMIMTLATAASWNFVSFAIFRALAGTGIGGEYAAINSAIDELIPSSLRGRIDLGINGTWWMGTILGSAASLVLLNERIVDPRVGWRLTFVLGAILALPRWLILHGRKSEAERVAGEIEQQVQRSTGVTLAAPSGDVIVALRQEGGLPRIFQTMLRQYPMRSFVALCLMIAQAFLYNAIFFTEALVLGTFFDVPADRIPLYIFPFALGNLIGPIALGPLFDTIGRRTMIAATYGLSAILLALTGAAFIHGALTATTLTALWCVVFFFASAGASSAYLTAGEIFPLHSRAMAIAVIYAIGTLVGGAVAPTLFGALIATKSTTAVFEGYLVASGAMIAAAVIELVFGVEAARRMLEEIAT